MTEEKTIQVQVEFEGLTTAAANQAAEELEDRLRQLTRGQLPTERIKPDPDTQDFGATLGIILGSASVVAVAKGIGDYIAKSGNKVVIKTASGEVIATGDAAANMDVAAVVAALNARIT